jgi:hypothetical protein
VSLEQDLGHRSNPLSFAAASLPRRRLGPNGHLHVIETGDLAAGRAEEVGVVAAMMAAAGGRGFKSPDMITEFDPGDEFGLGEFGEITVDRGSVESMMVEGL